MDVLGVCVCVCACMRCAGGTDRLLPSLPIPLRLGIARSGEASIVVFFIIIIIPRGRRRATLLILANRVPQPAIRSNLTLQFLFFCNIFASSATSAKA